MYASGSRNQGEVTVRLVTHDSFAASEAVLDDFRTRTGIRIEVVPSGDAGELVNKAVLTKGRPLGDVLFGVDNTFLSRALAEEIFEAHDSPALVYVAEEYQLDPEHRVTPVDHGEVCVNFDLRRFSGDTRPPASLEELTDPLYRDQLVVQNPATSSPGLAFLLATVERFGEPGWERFWSDLRANGVEIASGWEEAYNGSFSAGGGGGAATAGRLLRLESAGCGGLRRRSGSACHDGSPRGRLLPPDRVRRRTSGNQTLR